VRDMSDARPIGRRGWPPAAVVAATTIGILLVLPPAVDVAERASVLLGLSLAGIVAVTAGAIGLRWCVPTRWHWVRQVCLAILAAVAVAVSFELGDAWLNVWLLLAIAVGSAYAPAGRAILAVLGVTAAAGACVALSSSDDASVWAQMLVVFLTGGSNVVLVRLLTTIDELGHTRSELAERAVADERERFSRDLHDLLGHTLSVIVVKAEAVRRLVPEDPTAAAEHAQEIEAIGRRALGEVREAVHGYRRTSLTVEIDRARHALETAGIDVEVDVSPVLLPEPVEEVLAWVVREGATNVVRHSGAERCTLAVEVDEDRAELQIVDDGAGGPTPEGVPGTGLDGLRRRVAAMQGELTCSGSTRGFRLVADVPLAAQVVR
jgi:two-component system sensor histidine kinase DesK